MSSKPKSFVQEFDSDWFGKDNIRLATKPALRSGSALITKHHSDTSLHRLSKSVGGVQNSAASGQDGQVSTGSISGTPASLVNMPIEGRVLPKEVRSDLTSPPFTSKLVVGQPKSSRRKDLLQSTSASKKDQEEWVMVPSRGGKQSVARA